MTGDPLTYRPGLVGDDRRPARRVVTVDSGPLSLLDTLGTLDRVVAANDTDGGWSQLPADARARIPLLPRRFPTLADLTAYAPDLVVAGDNEAFGDDALGPRGALAAHGIRTFLLTEAALEDAPVVTPATIQATVDDLLALGGILGTGDRAATVATAWQKRIDAVAGRARPLRVFVLDMPRDGDVLTAGGAAVLNDLLHRAGGTLITADRPFTYGWEPWSRLAVTAPPDVLLVSDYGPVDVVRKLELLHARPELAAWRTTALPTVVLPLRDTVESAANIDALEHLATAFTALPEILDRSEPTR
ncbi:ABC transporter substrate-binding protein [Solwaraspora sp. WMMD1047]|uniref:ABC transporter substrate-binding protein n=1 Tax=Solwaraspora sp. WMMD1047 TaxID=3016102 RepID=UPI00241676A0|nr:ABC transporter substrate-binding protein [Solwaraspora sp. WMMD1047]MDG4833943.1 ABC transporter substrate-binding protein [Solwaraspora sp. WMMD1047]